MPDDTFRKIKDLPILWTDSQGITHACEGADIHRPIVGGGYGVRLIWTRCQRDVPANGAHLQDLGEVVDCRKCLAALDGQQP